jgi:hypothetical protein
VSGRGAHGLKAFFSFSELLSLQIFSTSQFLNIRKRGFSASYISVSLSAVKENIICAYSW